MKQEPGRRQPGISGLQAGEDVKRTDTEKKRSMLLSGGSFADVLTYLAVINILAAACGAIATLLPRETEMKQPGEPPQTETETRVLRNRSAHTPEKIVAVSVTRCPVINHHNTHLA